MPFIECSQVVKAYRVADHEIVALRGIDFEMEQGEMVAIIGPSGAGKSSLLNLLGGLDTPTAGQLIVDGQNLLDLKGRALSQYRLQEVGFIWQQVERNLLGHRSALGNVTLPMELAGVPPWERGKRARDLLNTVGMQGQERKHPSQLSGGQQQRVAVAMALANQPRLLLADEPTGSLDRATGAQVMALIAELRQKYGLTVLMVTHDMEIAAYADRVLTLRDGALGQDLTREAENHPKLDEHGRVQLPEKVRQIFDGTDGAGTSRRIAVEIRPEGVLLRPEDELVDETGALLETMLPQDAPPEKRSLFGRVFRRRSKDAKARSS